MYIIQDSREKSPWNFNHFERCDAQVVETLSAGDYCIREHPNLCVVERKHSSSEIYSNLVKNYDRFRKELIKLQRVKHAYIVCEFSEQNLLKFPSNTSLPKYVKKIVRMTGRDMLDRLKHIEEKYGVQTIFCKNRIEAMEVVMSIFEEVIQEEELSRNENLITENFIPKGMVEIAPETETPNI